MTKEINTTVEIERLLGNVVNLFIKRCGHNGIVTVYHKPEEPETVRIAYLGFHGFDVERTILMDTPVEPPEQEMSLRERIYRILDLYMWHDQPVTKDSVRDTTDAIFRRILPDTIHKQSHVRTTGPSSFRDDAAGYLAQHGQHGVVQDIVAEWVIDGPGNWIFQYETMADVRIACVGRNNVTNKLEIKWDNPA